MNRLSSKCAGPTMINTVSRNLGVPTLISNNIYSKLVYVPFNVTKLTDSVVISIKSTGNPSFWAMQATQLECPFGSPRNTLEARTINDGFLIAPNGCLQYFPNENGSVVSFNYNYGHGPYLSNLDYSICFRRTSTTKGLQ